MMAVESDMAPEGNGLRFVLSAFTIIEYTR